MKPYTFPSIPYSLAITLLTAVCAQIGLPMHAKEKSLAGDPIIREFGKYSASYMSDWSTLPTGDRFKRDLPQDDAYVHVVGEDARQEWVNKEEVRIQNLNLKVSWKAEKPDKKATTLFHIVNSKNVIIENLNVIQEDPDYRGYHTILIEGADHVLIRNLYLAGTVHSFHLRIEGCGDVFIDNVEVAGIDYYHTGRKRVGGGIWLNNGADGKGGIGGTGMWLPKENIRLPGWNIIQNCYFHDAIESDGGDWRNQDALLIHHPGNGLLFNCVVENWFHPPVDGGFDLSYRRSAPEYQDKFFRVERNILRNVTFGVKTPGRAGPNVLFLANNLFINAQTADYHNGYANEAYYVNNTYIYDANLAPAAVRDTAKGSSWGYARLWSYSGPTWLINSLIYSKEKSFTFLYGNSDAAPDKYLNYKSNHNLYALGANAPVWYRSATDGVRFSTMDAWSKASGSDEKSALEDPERVHFKNYKNEDFRLQSNPWPTSVQSTTRFLNTNDLRMRVDKDFYGQPRSDKNLAPGAFVTTP